MTINVDKDALWLLESARHFLHEVVYAGTEPSTEE